MKDIRTFLSEQVNNPDMLFLDERMYDGALCGTIQSESGETVAVYNENVLLEIMTDMMDGDFELAYEYYLFNIYNAYMGQNTPKFMNALVDGELYGGYN